MGMHVHNPVAVICFLRSSFLRPTFSARWVSPCFFHPNTGKPETLASARSRRLHGRDARSQQWAQGYFEEHLRDVACMTA